MRTTPSPPARSGRLPDGRVIVALAWWPAFVLVALPAVQLPVASAMLVAAATALCGGLDDVVRLRTIRLGCALTTREVRVVAIARTATFALPCCAALAGPGGGLAGKLAAGTAAVVAGLVLSYRSVAGQERRRLAGGPVEARGITDAPRIADLCRDVLRRTGPASRPWLEFNLAQALLTASLGTGVRRDRLDEAAMLLGRLAGSVPPDSELGRALPAVGSLLAMALARIDGDARAAAAMVELEGRAARGGDATARAEALASRSLLLIGRVRWELDDVLTGRADVESSLATLAEARALAEEARGLAPGIWYLLHLHAQSRAIEAAIGGDPVAADAAFADIRRTLADPPPDRPEVRTFTALTLASVLVYRHMADPGADLLADVEQVEGALRGALNDAHRQGLGADVLESLARLELLRYDLAPGPPAAFDRVVAAYRTAAEHMSPTTQDEAGLVLELADAAADYDTVHDMAATAAGLYAEGLRILHGIAAAGLARRHRVNPLRGSQRVASELAHWSVELGRPRDAATALETGRAFLLTESLHRERLELRLREHGRQRLADDYARMTGALARLELGAQATPGAAEPHQGTWWVSPDGIRHRRALTDARQRWEACLAEIRRVPGFADLQAAPRYEDLVRAAGSGALVYVTAAERRGYALVVTADPGGPRVVRLPGLRTEDLYPRARLYREGLAALDQGDAAAWRDRLHEVIDWLGMAVMDRLVSEIEPFADLTLIPCGALANMPLHAAGSADTRKRLAGHVFRYTPNARALLSAMETAAEAEREPPRMLVVAHSGEPPQALRTTPAQIDAVKRHFPTAHVLPETAATRDATLRAMRAHGLYHFACHGRADARDPLRSRLLLHDGPLTVHDLIRERFPAARLAVLSACETSVPHPDLPDEVISLPGALVEAGVPGTIGSLWQVREEPTALLTSRFYELWRSGGRTPHAALAEAQRWLRDSTLAELMAYSDGSVEWPRRTSKAIERLADERPFEHPDDWAAFIYTGL